MSIYHTLNKSLCEIFDVQYNPKDDYEPNIIPYKDIPAWNKGLSLSDEHKQALSESLMGYVYSEERNKKVSEGLKGNKNTPKGFVFNQSRNDKISKSLSGHKQSEEHKRKKVQSRMGVPSPRKDCPKCGKSVDIRNYGRWHGEKCCIGTTKRLT